MNLIGQKSPTNPEAMRRIKTWVYELFGLPEEVVVSVRELRCHEDDCPDVETVIGVLGEPGQARKHKVMKPMEEITREDIVSLAARGTHG